MYELIYEHCNHFNTALHTYIVNYVKQYLDGNQSLVLFNFEISFIQIVIINTIYFVDL